MIYLLCILCPPIAVLLKGKPIQGLLNLVLTLFMWVPGVIHSILVVNNANANSRHKKELKQLKELNKKFSK